MDTGGKVLVGAAVVIGGIFVYKAVTNKTAVQTAARPTQTPQASAVGGFLNLATSAFNYFSKQPPSPLVTPGVHGTGGAWDSTGNNYLPLGPGETAYADDTSHDNLLS